MTYSELTPLDHAYQRACWAWQRTAWAAFVTCWMWTLVGAVILLRVVMR